MFPALFYRLEAREDSLRAELAEDQKCRWLLVVSPLRQRFVRGIYEVCRSLALIMALHTRPCGAQTNFYL